MPAAKRRMIQVPIYVTREQNEELKRHADRLNLPAATIVRAAVDDANKQLRQASLFRELPPDFRASVERNHRRSITPRQRRPHSRSKVDL
jgi:hypothetical protein